jgi:hypothetical protein
MKKIMIMMILMINLVSFAEAKSVSRPNVDKAILNKFEHYFKDPKVKAFICSNATGSYIMAKKSLGLAYTTNDYYIFNNLGLSFVITKCEPAKIER